MSENYRPNRITSKKVWICVIIGLLLLLMCLAITSGYFDPNQEDRPSFISFAKNLANALGNSSSLLDGLKDWLFDGIQNLGQYFNDYVNWPPILLTVFAFVAFCYAVFQILKAAAEMLGKGDMSPFNWDLKSTVLSRLGADKLFNKLSFSSNPSTVNAKQIEDDTDIKEIVQRLKESDSGPYLILIDKLAPNDHFALFWNSITVEIETQGIKSDRFFLSGDPRFCFNEDHEEGIALESLSELYQDAILIYIGDGGMLLQKGGVQLMPWYQQFEKWSTRYLLSPKNYFEWDKREKELQVVFHALPAKLSSIEYLIHRPNLDSAPLEYDIKKHVNEFLIDYQEDGIDAENTFVYFAPPTLHWIQACALYPSLHLDLTLEIGEQIFNEYNLTVAPENHVPFNALVILSVFELRWFREGLIPDANRAQLGMMLEKEVPVLSDSIRTFLDDFPCPPPPEDSVPGYKHLEFTWINRWLIRKREVTKIERKEFKKKLNWMYFLGFWPSIFLFDFDGPHNRISKHIKWPSIRKFIFNFGISGLGLTQHFINICWSIFSGLLLLFTYLLIIWLSRPAGEDICMPVTQTIYGDGTNPISIDIRGTMTKPKAAFILGTQTAGTDFRISGNNVVVTKVDGSTRLNQKNNAIQTTLTDTDTLRFLIRDSVSIVSSDQFDITIIACLNDTVGYTIKCPPPSTTSWNTSYSVRPNPPVRSYWRYFGGTIFQSLGDRFRYNGATHIYRGTSPDSRRGVIDKDNCPQSSFLFVLKDPGPNSIMVIERPGDTISDPPGNDSTFYIFDLIDSSVLKFQPLDTLFETKYRDTLIRIDTVIRRVKSFDSLNIRDSINIRDSVFVPKMIISGTIWNCSENYENALVSARRIPSLLVSDGYNEELLTIKDEGSNSFSFAYEYNVDSPINFVFSLPDDSPFNFISQNSFPDTMVDGYEKTIRLKVFDSSYVKSEVINLLGDFIIPCDRGNLLEIDEEEAAKFKVFYINSKGQVERIKHQRGNVCQDIINVDFCDSHLQIEYEDQIIETLYLRNYKVLYAGTKDAVLDIQSRIIYSQAVACS